jgi:hypothetical protein
MSASRNTCCGQGAQAVGTHKEQSVYAFIRHLRTKVCWQVWEGIKVDWLLLALAILLQSQTAEYTSLGQKMGPKTALQGTVRAKQCLQNQSAGEDAETASALDLYFGFGKNMEDMQCLPSGPHC